MNCFLAIPAESDINVLFTAKITGSFFAAFNAIHGRKAVNMILSFFRRSNLWATEEELWRAILQRKVSPEITQVKIERRFLVDSARALRKDELQKLEWLLTETYEPQMFGEKSAFKGEVIEVGPRLAIVTPSSTNTVSICSACGLDSIRRVEQTRRFSISLKKGAELSPEQVKRIYALIHDRMTEQPYKKPPETFEQDIEPEPVRLIPLLENGIDILKETNETLGLALDRQMMEYLFEYYKKINRNPTDVELFMFGQLNSEHCRHHLFKGNFVVDGRRMENSLFDMIRSTTRANPGNVVVAYEDNAAVTSGRAVNIFRPSDPVAPSAFIASDVLISDTFKAETHNHPTTISADPGAGTGLGGNIRDIQGVGRGGTVLAALAIYNVANLLIADYVLPWEKEYAVHPSRFQTPLEIIIEASNGASDYGNKFGVPLTTGSCTSFELMTGGEHYGWKKTCMVAGNWGIINAGHAEKNELENGFQIVQIGGDRYPIGLGGGSGSSKDAGGQEADLDFDSVQRANPEMENRNESVIRACAELGDKSPIVSITDLGAGGECVALPEIVHPHGAKYELRNIPCGDKTMSVLVFWCNESQESMVMIVKGASIAVLERICGRNRCPMYIIGEVSSDGKLVLTDKNAPSDAPRERRVPIDLDMEFLLANLPEMTIDCRSAARKLSSLKLPQGLTVYDALERVLRLLKVGSKHFLTRKVDRSVGGLSALQQTTGPLQLTVADCAVTARSFVDTTGIATAIGEQPVKGLIETEAGGRMSLAESLTNLVWAPIEDFSSINFSATWQWPCKQPGEDARLYNTVRATTDLCKQLGLRIPVGKDSVSMTAWTTRNGEKHSIKSPGSVQIIGFAPCSDITKAVTPDIKKPGEGLLVMLDLSGSNKRLGGSALAQVYEQLGDETPDVEDSVLLKNGFEAVQQLMKEGLVLAGHDVSEGGLITCLLEMAFAGNCGLDLELDESGVFSEPDVFAALFAEELALVFEILPEDLKKAEKIICRYGFDFQKNAAVLGRAVKEPNIKIKYHDKEVLDADMRVLRDIWQQTSFELDKLQANPACSEAERKANFERKGPKYNLSFEPAPTPEAKMKAKNKPKVAILREAGTNGAREMAGAFYAAGFEAWDVTMADIAEARVSLKDFRGVAFSGGFCFADVLDAGKGWAGVIMFNERIRGEFEAFVERQDTFSLGICNGCQVMALLGWIPWRGIEMKKQPRFVRNASNIFESRFVSVKVLPSESIFFKDMAGSVLGVWVAHAEGRCLWPDEEIFRKSVESGNNLAPLRFVDDEGNQTEQYPFNPNGSQLGITGVCSQDGRHLAVMPHPERSFQLWQWPYRPPEWSNLKASPWLKLFQNARQWCEQNPA
ncbi:MAG: phosphoribosylformylglycinamidine synthase [Sedimentisphaerales bacterium]|nr:phosphoribosylformylglycinamidine synthase [Sedimentisphaerales bacterium]